MITTRAIKSLIINVIATSGKVVLLGAAMLGAANAAVLNNVEVATLPGDKVQITFKLSEPVAEPRSFTIGNPARIALDFANTTNGMANKSQDLGTGVAQSLSIAEAGGRTRAVIRLTDLVPYSTIVEGNTVSVILGEGGSSSASSVSAAPAAASSSSSAAASGISAIDFRRGESGEGRVIVTLSDPSIAVDVRDESGQVIIDVLNADVPDELVRRLDVLDFGTPVKTIDTGRRGRDTRLVVTPSGLYEHLAYQSDNLLTVELRPLTAEEEEEIKKEKFTFTGERLSLNFQNIEVRAVLQLIADFTGLNVVVSDTVSGSMTLRLKDVPWDQALDIILKTKGLDKRQNGNVMLIAPTEEIAAREKLELESAKQIEELAPLRSEFVQVNYAKASEISALITSGGDSSMLSTRGSITVDERTNTLMVRDTAENLQQIRKLVATLDIAVRQVLIESRIVVATDNFTQDIGVQFGYSKNYRDCCTPGSFGGIVGGTRPGDTAYGGTTAFESAAGSGNEGLISDLAATGATSSLGMAVGRIGSYLLQLELSAMEQEGNGQVISNPRVVTANQRKATIKAGAEIPYQEASSSGATSVSFKEAVLSLEVTPQITPDDRIIMDLVVSKDSVGTVYGGIPSINTNEISTQVLVNNGETVVLGGIYEQEDNKTQRRVPFFADLPFVGKLFQNNLKSDDKSELLIFVTPKILKQDLSTR